MVDETGQPYAYTEDDPVNGTDPLGLCSTSGGTFLVSGACHWTSRSWVSQTENTLQGQKGGGFSITNGLKAVADYGAGIGNAAVSTVTLGHVHVAPPYCGFGWASDVGMGYGYVALAVLGGGAGGAAEVSDGAATVEEVEAEGQAADAEEAVETASRPASVFWSGGGAAKDAATDYATSTGGSTLEMTPAGQALEAATQGMDYVSQARPLWAAASRDFAAQASGDVHVFQNAVSLSRASIWATDEYPELVSNSNVTDIVYHLVGL